MTVRVTTLKGAAAGGYYVEQLGRYYLDAGEPAGRWLGRQAEALGLVGDAAPDDFLALMAGREPATGEQLGRLYGDRSARGYDVTMSAPKSVSVLWAVGDADVKAQIETALDTAARTVMGFIEGQAHTRILPAPGAPVTVVDTQGIAACLFRQHTSRSLDPQLHVHGVVIAKVQDPHDRWKALDARMVKRDQRCLSAVFHAALRSELTWRLGVAWDQPVNGIAEMAGVTPGVLAAFSSRTAQVEERTQVKLDRFRAQLGRDPTATERWRLEREAVVDSRPTKPHAGAADDHHARWRDELTSLGIEPPELQDALVRQIEPRLELSGIARRAIANIALDALQAEQSAWRRNDIVRELCRAWPTDVAAHPDQLPLVLGHMADQLIASRNIELAPRVPEIVPRRVSDRRPITESTLDRQLTTAQVLREEEAVIDWARCRWARAGLPATLEAGPLDRAQHLVASEVAGTAELAIVVGPAGAGKTAALRPAVERLIAQRRSVFVTAPSATAAAIVRNATDAPGDTIAKLLHEHARAGGPGAGYELPAGTTLIVDEAGMIPTPDLVCLARLADHQHWRVVLIGDPQQLAPVGRGGMFRYLANIGPTLELERIHRFREPWERDASLRLRRGESEVISLYDRHDRIHPALTRIDAYRAAIDRWDEARDQGSVIMVASSNATAAVLNTHAQRRRIDLGELDPTAGAVRTGAGEHLLEGDRIVTRHNDRDVLTDHGVAVRNRSTWTVTDVWRDGSLDATGPDGRIHLPADYVHDAVELGYAQTVHGAQGATVDRSILVLDGPADGRTIYVGLTRGALSNDAIVVTDADRDPVDILAAHLANDWTDRPATAVHIDLVVEHLARGYSIDELLDAGFAGPGLGGPGRIGDAPAINRPHEVSPPERDLGIEL